MRSSADLHVGDLHFGELLAMPGMPAIPGAARETEDAHLLVLAVAHDLGRDLGARLGFEQRHPDNQTRLGLELLAADRENGVGHGSGTLMVPWVSVKPPHTARSRPARPAWPSCGTRPGASSGRHAPRARARSPSPTGARS